MLKNKLLSIIKIISLTIFIPTFAIAFTVLCRPFYYAYIQAMNLVEETGYTLDITKNAYYEMLDFCIGIKPEFSTGDWFSHRKTWVILPTAEHFLFWIFRLLPSVH